MSENVKPSRRRYDASGRRARAEQTREQIVREAGALFTGRGYAATTVTDIARRAGVSPETIYKAFGSKAALLRAAVSAALRGDAGSTPLRERAAIEAIRREPDPRAKLDRYGRLLAEVQPRLAPLVRVMREAAVADPDMAQALKELNADRLEGMTEFARHLARTGALRPGISPAHARDVLWTLNSPEVYELLVDGRGWNGRRYGKWVAGALAAALFTQDG